MKLWAPTAMGTHKNAVLFFCTLALSAVATVANIKIRYDQKRPNLLYLGHASYVCSTVYLLISSFKTKFAFFNILLHIEKKSSMYPFMEILFFLFLSLRKFPCTFSVFLSSEEISSMEINFFNVDPFFWFLLGKLLGWTAKYWKDRRKFLQWWRLPEISRQQIWYITSCA